MALVPVEPWKADPEPSSVSAFVDWRSFWERDRSEQEWLFEPILARGRGHVFYAKHKSMKSLLLQWLAGELATGRDPVTVIYLDYEMGEDDLFERLSDMGYDAQSDLTRLKYALLPSLPPLDTEPGAEALLALLDQVELERHSDHLAVIIDTTARAVAGAENDSDTIRNFYRLSGLPLRQRGITWVRLDHAGKDSTRGQRGSSAKGDDVDIVWRLEPAQDGLILHRDAARMGWIPETVPLHRHTDPLRFSVTAREWPPGTTDAAEMLDRLGVPVDMSVRNARKALSVAGESVSQAVLTAAVKYRRELI